MITIAKHTTLSSLFTAIADAIRTKKGTTDTIVADNFPDEIAALSNAEPAVIEPLDVTENGTYTAPEGVDGYSPVTVNVEPDVETETWEFTLEDDSVVTKEVQLVVGDESDGGDGGITPTGTISITSNGTHNVTNYASANVNVPTEIPDGYADVSGVTAAAADVLASKKIVLSDGTPATGTIPTIAGDEITPGTDPQTAISEGYYADGDITVAGDSNLVPSNIKSGVSIFGVEGSYTGSSGGSILGSPVTILRLDQYRLTFNVSNASKVVAFFVLINGDSIGTDDGNWYYTSLFHDRNTGKTTYEIVRYDIDNGSCVFSGSDTYVNGVTFSSSSITIEFSYQFLGNTYYTIYPIYSA